METEFPVKSVGNDGGDLREADHDVEQGSSREARQEENAHAEGKGAVDVSTADRDQARSEGGVDWLDDEETSLEESVWCMAFFIGLSQIGRPPVHVYATLLLLTNIAIQIFFILIVFSTMTTDTFTWTNIESLRLWRLNVAHDFKNSDPLSGRSLANRVCADEAGLELSGDQRALHSTLSLYLRDLGSGVRSGPLMCLLALLVWTLSCCKELIHCEKLGRALSHVPRGPRTVLRLSSKDDCGVEELSLARYVFCVIVTLVRLGLCLALLVAGAMYLSVTVGLADLLLNALALEMVLNVDDLLFAALGPHRFASFMAACAPFPLPSNRIQVGSLDIETMLSAVFLLGLLGGVIVPLQVLPFVDRTIAADDAMCGGTLDFVFSVGGLGLPSWSKSAPGPASKAINNWKAGQVESANFMQGVLDFVLEGEAECSRSFCEDSQQIDIDTGVRTWPDGCCVKWQTRVPEMAGGRFSVKAFSLETISTALELYNPYCQDVLDAGPPSINLLHGSLSIAIDATRCGGTCPEGKICGPLTAECVVPTCQVLQPFCRNESDAAVRTRQLCPQTCGCADVRSDLLLSTPDMGCGAACAATPKYRDVMDTLPCADAAHDSPSIVGYATEWFRLADEWPSDWKLAQLYARVLMSPEAGCKLASLLIDAEAMGEGSTMDMCREGGTPWPIKGIAHLCPVACGCRGSDPHCPSSCPGNATRSVVSIEERNAMLGLFGLLLNAPASSS